MKEDIKLDWANALEGDEYSQGRSFLKREEKDGFKHCCLGVLCELYHKATGLGVWENDTKMPSIHRFSAGITSSTLLPTDVRIWAGLEAGIPLIYPVKALPNGPHLGINTYDTLAQVNDGGYTFAQISEIIKKDL